MSYPKPDFLEEYIQYMRMKKMAPQTIQNYLFSLKNIPVDVEKYFSTDTIDGANIIPAYRSYLEFLHRKKKLITRGELEDLKDTIKVERKRGNNHSEKKFSIPEPEWGNYIRKVPNRVSKMGVWLGFHFGLRLGEILHLRVRDINFQEQLILIRSHKEAKNQDKWNPKYNRERQVPFTNNQARTLKKWINERPDLKTPYLLWTTSGEREGLIVINKTFQSHCSKAGLRPHVLRYSFATHWYEKTKDIKFVSDMLGHSKVSVTSDYLCLGKKESIAKARKYFDS